MEESESNRKHVRKDNKHIWTVSEKKGHHEDLTDMGLALLGESPVENVDLDYNEDIENRSPNLGQPISSRLSPGRKKQQQMDDTGEKKRLLTDASSSASKKIRHDDSIKKTHDSSPQTTCDAHPDLHKPPACLPRLATFDDGQSTQEAILTPERTLVEESCDSYYSDELECAEEKECFVAHNKSFCNSKSHCNHDEDDCDGYFSQFSDEVMLSILQWLPKRMLVRCMLVCKRWYRLASDGRLWARVDLGGKVLPPGSLPTLLSRHTIILRLATAQLQSPVIDSVPLCGFRIQYLDLTAAAVTPECLSLLLQFCPLLINLSLEGLDLNEDCAKSLSSLVQLRTLNMALVTGLEKCMSQVICKMDRLESLNIAWTKLVEEELVKVSSVMPRGLMKLNIAGCRNTLHNGVIEKLVSRCPKLVELDLSDSSRITELSVRQLINLYDLEHLALSRCYSLKIGDYMLLPNSPKLKFVEVFGLVPPLSLAHLQKCLPQIQFNKFMHSSVARPTVGNRRTSIWGLRTRD